MRVSITLLEGHPDALRTLRRQLLGLTSVERVDLTGRPVRPGELGGGAVEILTVALGAGGAGTVVAAQVLGWLRTSSRLKVHLRVREQEWDIEAAGIRRMSPEETAELLAAIARAMEKAAEVGVDDD